MTNQIDKLKLIKNLVNDFEHVDLYIYGNDLFIYGNDLFQLNKSIIDLKNNINILIDEYYFLNQQGFEKIKKNIMNILILIKGKILFIDLNHKFLNTVNNIIYLLETIYYPVYFNNQKIKFYHKQNTFDNYKNNYIKSLDKYDELENENDVVNKKINQNNYMDFINKTNEIDDEKIYNNKQRNFIKNNSKLNLKSEKNIDMIENTDIKENKKQYKIISKKIKINWKKSYITI